MRVVVRPWQRADQEGASAVLREGSFSNLWPSFRIALLRPATLGIALLIVGIGFITDAGILLILLSLLCLLSLVYLACLAATVYFFYGPNFNDMKRVDTTYFDCPDNHFWVAEVDDLIAGTIAVVRKDPENDAAAAYKAKQLETSLSDDVKTRHSHSLQNATEIAPKVAWLRRMAVKHKFRGHGIAKQLVKAVINFCQSRDYDIIHLITTEVHQPACALYKSMGFEQKAFKPYKHLGGLVSVWTYEFQMDLRK